MSLHFCHAKHSLSERGGAQMRDRAVTKSYWKTGLYWNKYSIHHHIFQKWSELNYGIIIRFVIKGSDVCFIKIIPLPIALSGSPTLDMTIYRQRVEKSSHFWFWIVVLILPLFFWFVFLLLLFTWYLHRIFSLLFVLHFYEDYKRLVEIAVTSSIELVLAEIIVYITCSFKCFTGSNQLFLSPGSWLMVERSFVLERSDQTAVLSL